MEKFKFTLKFLAFLTERITVPLTKKQGNYNSWVYGDRW